MAVPRLPSGVYFTLFTGSAASEKHYTPEYPTFPKYSGAETSRGSHAGSVYADPGRSEHVTQHRPRIERSLVVGDGGQRPSQPQTPHPELCLPLLSVSVEVQVDCNIAKTKVVQTFTNHGGMSIPEAWYTFPLYDGAAVTAFRCEVGDDKVLEGKVKPKAEARSDFERAIQKREAAALVEEMSPDIFQTTIGNINPRTAVKVEITYVEELHTDLSGDGILLTIPTSVAPRYGAPPVGYATNSTIKETGLSLVINLASSGPMRAIACRSGHGISIEYGQMSHLPEATSFEALAELQSQADSGFNPNHATARLSIDHTAMDRDIVLFIPSPDEVLLKSRALLAPSSGSDHAAMMVTVRPSELFSDLQESLVEFDGEIIFLADRSGSMGGPKIEALKDALLVLLKSLPAKCKFNLYSFGSDVSALWSRSTPYDDSTAQEALDYVSTFQADFGGTEVLNALRKAVDDRRTTDISSTQVILLTDGEIWQAQETIEFVRMTTSNAEDQVRFFSLGIGSQVSHQLIQGIGFFGGGLGEAVTVDSHGKWKEAVIRMLKGAVMPTSWSYTIGFGDEWNEHRLDVDDVFLQHVGRNTPRANDRIARAVSPSFVQSPRAIPCLHHFGHQSVYFLLDTTIDKLPEQVVITACSHYGRTKMASLAVTRATSNSSTIQHLAAKAAVRDLERHDTSEVVLPDQMRKSAERLCQMYTISSKWTSFVAVSHLQQSTEYEDVEVNLYKASLAELDLLTNPGVSHAGVNVDTLTHRIAHLSDETSWPSVRSDSRSPGISSQQYCGSDEQRDHSPIYFDKQLCLDLSDNLHDSDEHSLTALTTSAASEEPNTEFEVRNTSPTSKASQGVSNAPRGSRSYDMSIISAPTIDWQELIRGQRADGLFHFDKSLGHTSTLAQHFCHGTRKTLQRWLVGRLKRPASGDNKEREIMGLLVDTVMSLSYIRSHVYSQRALWDLLVLKAEGRVVSLLNPGEWGRPGGLAAMADSALAHAHYGRCSQGGDEDSWRIHNPSNGRCGVCTSQSKEWPSADMHEVESGKCPVSGCDVSLGKWDEFWAHAVEQGHISSACEVARIRYSKADAKTAQ